MLAVISDIHGNLAALETVLADINQQGITAIVCLGDVANFGPQPRECIEKIAAVGCPTILGNTDDWLVHPKILKEHYRSPDSPMIIEIEHWCSEQISQKHIDIIDSYLPKLETTYKDVSCLFYHASPKNHTDHIIATTANDVLEDYFSDYAGAGEGSQLPTLCIGGHTHAQLLRRYMQSFVVNPGSVGLPYQYQTPEIEITPAWAEYAIIDVLESQHSAQHSVQHSVQPTVSFRRIPYDMSPTLEAAKVMPHSAYWSRNWQQV